MLSPHPPSVSVGLGAKDYPDPKHKICLCSSPWKHGFGQPCLLSPLAPFVFCGFSWLGRASIKTPFFLMSVSSHAYSMNLVTPLVFLESPFSHSSCAQYLSIKGKKEDKFLTVQGRLTFFIFQRRKSSLERLIYLPKDMVLC